MSAYSRNITETLEENDDNSCTPIDWTRRVVGIPIRSDLTKLSLTCQITFSVDLSRQNIANNIYCNYD